MQSASSSAFKKPPPAVKRPLIGNNFDPTQRQKFDRDSKETIRSRGEKRLHCDDRSGSSRYSSGSSPSSYSIKEKEEDPIILKRRTKQIDYGKNSVAYDNYISKVPKDKRPFYLPRTPDK